jgi:acyl-CoA thioester hydrolase
MDGGPLAGFCGREHILPVRVYYEDTDFGGVVYHANYVRYLERGRSEFIRAIGASHSSLMRGDRPATFMVSALEMRFVRPARIDDLLEIRTLVEWVRGARIWCRQAVFRGNELVLEASVENVCVSLDGRPRRPPSDLMQRLRPFLGPPVVTVEPVLANGYAVAAE